jgi:CheY-like chemotaxis protein
MTTTASAGAAAEPATHVMPSAGLLRVLVVDDHAESVEPLARLLAMHGHAVSMATSADEALDQARAGRFDLLLSDLDMPITDGCELLRRVRALYSVRGVAISAHTGTNFARAASAAGYERVLIKPLHFDEVLAAVAGTVPPA